MNNKRIKALIFIFVINVFGLLVLAGWGYQEYLLPPPPWLGNSHQNIAKLAHNNNDNAFSFALIADIHNIREYSEDLFDKLLLTKPDFMVILGDFVDDADIHEYHFFTAEMNEIKSSCPVFIIPGNHDITDDNPATKQLFKTLWGPMNYFFHYQGCLFIFLNNATHKSVPESWDFLNNTLAREAQKAKKIFLFCHIPPFYRDRTSRELVTNNDYAPLFNLIEQYKVDYLFTGHLHERVVKRIGNCMMLSVGSGGGKLRGKDLLYNGIIIHCDGNTIYKKDVFAYWTMGVEDAVERILFLSIYPVIHEVKSIFYDSIR